MFQINVKERRYIQMEANVAYEEQKEIKKIWKYHAQ